MIKRWLCKVGIHKWKVMKTSEGIFGFIHYRQCQCCETMGIKYQWR